MKLNNPMNNPEIRIKILEARKGIKKTKMRPYDIVKGSYISKYFW